MRLSSERFRHDFDPREQREEMELQLLLVEDSPDDAALIRHAFARSNPVRFDVDSVTDLESATRCMEDCQYDAVLLDLGLPDSSGALTFQWACPHTANCPVIVLSASEDPHLIATAGSYGIYDYLIKDHIDRNSLPATIIEAIAGHAHQFGG